MTDKNADGAGANRITVALQRVYLKDCSFEAPSSPSSFSGEWRPVVTLNIATRYEAAGDDTWEVTLSLTVETKVADRTAFLIEVQQAGQFVFKGLAEDDLRRVLVTFCPHQLYPYAREAVADLAGKGGFPQLHLQPVNFDALAAEAQKRQQADEQSWSVSTASSAEG
jgi:preprotein translocase subunit SecB